MPLFISAHFAFTLEQPTDVLLQFEAAAIPEQAILSANARMPDSHYFARVSAQDDIGERIWLRGQGSIEVAYEATVEIRRALLEIVKLERLPFHKLPGETVQYLLDSRYCPAGRFQPFVDAEFDGTEGGTRIAAIREWISDKFTYESGSSGPTTDAIDSFVERRGVCRDYAHVLVTLARASGIPARYVSAFAPAVDPPDFHAVAEVFLSDPEGESGRWHIVDATGMADAEHTAKIGVGRDAADVSFLTSFGFAQLDQKQISVRME